MNPFVHSISVVLLASAALTAANAKAAGFDCEQARAFDQAIPLLRSSDLKIGQPARNQLLAYLTGLAEKMLDPDQAEETLKGYRNCFGVGSTSMQKFLAEAQKSATDVKAIQHYVPNPDRSSAFDSYVKKQFASLGLTTAAGTVGAMIGVEQKFAIIEQMEAAGTFTQAALLDGSVAAAIPAAAPATVVGAALASAGIGYFIGSTMIQIDDQYFHGEGQNFLRTLNFGEVFLPAAVLNLTPWKQFNSIQGVMDAAQGNSIEKTRRIDAEAAAAIQFGEIAKVVRLREKLKSQCK